MTLTFHSKNRHVCRTNRSALREVLRGRLVGLHLAADAFGADIEVLDIARLFYTTLYLLRDRKIHINFKRRFFILETYT